MMIDKSKSSASLKKNNCLCHNFTANINFNAVTANNSRNETNTYVLIDMTRVVR